MLKRSKPMKRTGFKPRVPPRPAKVIDYTPTSRALPLLRMADTRARLSVPLPPRPRPKDSAVQSEAYMAAVRRLACARCGTFAPGLIQFCHADAVGGRGGKGKGLKSDCRRGWPGCGPHGAERGCHWYVGTSGRMKKDERRAFEAEAGARTRGAVEAAGWWPAGLPKWDEEREP